MRFEDKFEFEIIIDSKVDQEYKIPPLLLQPLLENAIKHGFKDISYKGKLSVSFSIFDDKLMISVIDNGTGIEIKNPSSDHKSLSWNILRDRN